MGTGTAISLVIGLLALIAMVAFYTNDQVDKKIQKAVNDPIFLSLLAKEVQLPFIIVDEKGVYRYEHNALDLIEEIDVALDDDDEVKSIEIIPKQMLAAPPIVEPINFGMEFAEPESVKPFSWVFYPAEGEGVNLRARADKKPDPAKKLIRQFKVTLIKKK
jgi:hypothetical protein